MEIKNIKTFPGLERGYAPLDNPNNHYNFHTKSSDFKGFESFEGKLLTAEERTNCF